MAEPVGVSGSATPARSVGQITIEWSAETNEQGGDMRWLGCWLTGLHGPELNWFYSGQGNESTRHLVPAAARGVRIRKWVSEGLDPEYIDLPIEAGTAIRTAELDFDTPQPHRQFVLANR